jgi:hypothetical protein
VAGPRPGPGASVTHYEVLGVGADADLAAIRAAWLRLARRHHPDFHVGGGAVERAEADRRMREINEAWSVLSDPRRRQAYDRRIGVGATGIGGAHGFRPFVDEDDDSTTVSPLAEDEPGPPPTLARRALTLAPMGVLALAGATFCAGLVLANVGLVAAAVAQLVLAGVLFVLVPLVAMAEAERAARPVGPVRRRRRRRR